MMAWSQYGRTGKERAFILNAHETTGVDSVSGLIQMPELLESFHCYSCSVCSDTYILTRTFSHIGINFKDTVVGTNT